MLIEPREYHCPQCGYNLRGQTVNRCPECGFLYDLPALRQLAWDAFWNAMSPYLRAAKLLAAAGILGLAAICMASGPARTNPLAFICLPLGALFLLSPRLIEAWVVGDLARQSRDLEWLNSVLKGGWIGLIFFFRFVMIMPGLARLLATATVAAGLAWAAYGLMSTEPNSLLSATMQQNAILGRARFAAWMLVIIDCFILLLVCII